MPSNEWVYVTAFNEKGATSNFSVRLTKAGVVFKRDSRYIFEAGFLIPLRYSDGGIHRLNPDVGWPKECLLPGEPPEVYARWGVKLVADLHEQLIRHHPDKLTAAEKTELGGLERQMIAGTASEEGIARRNEILGELETRDTDLNEW